MIVILQESSGPVTSVTPAHNLEPPPDSTSSVVKLNWTCRKLGLALPVYKVHDIRPKRGPVIYDCTVKVSVLISIAALTLRGSVQLPDKPVLFCINK